MMDDFDRFWQWANKPLESRLTIPADIHHASRCRRQAGATAAKVNEAMRKMRSRTGGAASRSQT